MFTIAGNESIDNDKNNLFQGQVEQKISRDKKYTATSSAGDE
ncbi:MULTISPECIES: hypothetical protein [Bacillus]|nr:hypothetical protein [Bacillus cereus]